MNSIVSINNQAFAQPLKQEPNTFVIELSAWEELIGIYKGYNIAVSSIYIYIDDKTLVLPCIGTLVAVLQSQNLIGKIIGILRTDIPSKPFLIRLVEG